MKPFEVLKAMLVAAMMLLSVHSAHAGEYMGYRLAALKTLPMVVFMEAPEGGRRPVYVAEHVNPHVLPPATIVTPDTRLVSSMNEKPHEVPTSNPLVVRVYDRFVVANIVGPLSYYDLYNPDGSRKQRRELDYFGIDISRRGDASLVVCQKGVVWIPNDEATIIWQPKFWLANERSTRPGVIGPIGIEFELKAIWRPKKW